MSDFLQRFLREDPGEKPALCLAAFGKHPGWDDHLDDFGLETETLANTKKLLYLRGIASQIDAGAWESLPPEKQLAGFNHRLLWARSNSFVAGLLWSSQDGKGRAKYPMVLCVHVLGLPPSWSVAHIFPVLEELKTACRSAATAAEVIRLLTDARARLRAALPPVVAPAMEGIYPPPDVIDATALHRVLYELRSQWGAFSPGNVDTRSPLALPSRKLRAPASPADARALLAWSRFVSSQLAANIPVLGLAAADGGTVDLIASEPAPQDFFCLRTSTRGVPLTTDIPYTLDRHFIAEADAIIHAASAARESETTIFGEKPKPGAFTRFPWSLPSLSGKTTITALPETDPSAPPPLPSSSPASPERPSSSLRWVQILFVVLGLAVIGFTLFLAAKRH